MAAKKKLAKVPLKKAVGKKPAGKLLKSSKPVKKGLVAKKESPKKESPKKALTKKNLPGKLIAGGKPIKKIAPVKKTAMPEAKKAAPKKLSVTKKTAVPVNKATAINKEKSAAKAGIKRQEVKKSVPKIEVSKPLVKAKDIKVTPPKQIVLPKISTTKARKYEPEFTKSVLDQAAPENNGPRMRYSDGELNEFKELIQRKLETAKKELGYLQGLITRKDEMGGDETDNRYMTMEDGSLSMEREQLSQMASRQITFIDHLEKATMRIENKTYGICRVTGKLIDKARLRAVPHATLSMEAKMGIVK